MTALRCLRCFALVLLWLPVLAHAHVGSKDVFQQVDAGPYRLFVTIRPPLVIPGVAEVEIRTSGAAVDALKLTPTPMTGEASRHPPTADSMKRSAVDPAFFTGSVWLMAPGAWKVSIAATGVAGAAEVSVPVPALPLIAMRMGRDMGFLLGGMGLLLTVGVTGIVTAAVREARLRPGVQPTPRQRSRSLVVGGATLLAVAVVLVLGGWWWQVEAGSYAADVYRPLNLRPTLQGGTLRLSIGTYIAGHRPWRNRLNTDLLPDHGHLMHLYAIREPDMDAVYHLHPGQTAPGELATALPAMPAGSYRLFADIVHGSGLPETLTATLDIPAGFHGAPLDSEDAAAAPPPIASGELGAVDRLPDGYTMVWDRPAALHAGQPVIFRFRLLNASGQPAADVFPYLGMAGHAAFVKTDWMTFAHTHPAGSAPMQSLKVANAGTGEMAGMEAVATGAPAKPLPATVEFPYGFPQSGRYRIFVQMKHGSTVETGTFDATVQ